MASRVMEIIFTIVILALLSSNAAAQTSSGCTTALISLAPCLSFITGNASTPSSSCCSQLASVVANQAPCLCSLLNGGGSSFGIPINQTQALALPGACNVKTPPISQCNAAAPAPSAPQTPATPSVPTNPTPATPSTPSVTPSSPSVPSGSKDTPSTTSDGSSNNSGRSMICVAFFVAACVSSFVGL